MKSKHITIRIPETLANVLDEVSASKGLSRSAMVTEAIQFYLLEHQSGEGLSFQEAADILATKPLNVLFSLL